MQADGRNRKGLELGGNGEMGWGGGVATEGGESGEEREEGGRERVLQNIPRPSTGASSLHPV